MVEMSCFFTPTPASKREREREWDVYIYYVYIHIYIYIVVVYVNVYVQALKVLQKNDVFASVPSSETYSRINPKLSGVISTYIHHPDLGTVYSIEKSI